MAKEAYCYWHTSDLPCSLALTSVCASLLRTHARSDSRARSLLLSRSFSPSLFLSLPPTLTNARTDHPHPNPQTTCTPAVARVRAEPRRKLRAPHGGAGNTSRCPRWLGTSLRSSVCAYGTLAVLIDAAGPEGGEARVEGLGR